MRNIEELDHKVQRGKWKHEQHTKDFIKELNKPAQVQEPFRISDEVWKVGKYKGTKIQDTPTHYIKWIYNNFTNLSKSHKAMLEEIIKKK